MVAIGNDHEKTIKAGMKWYVHNCQPPPPPKEEEEATGSSQPPPPKRACSEVEKEDVETLPSWRDEFDDIEWGTEEEADKNALASRRTTPRSSDVSPPKKQSEKGATRQETDADPPHRATNADVKPVLK